MVFFRDEQHLVLLVLIFFALMQLLWDLATLCASRQASQFKYLLAHMDGLPRAQASQSNTTFMWEPV
jgi:hypothetical protein